MRRFENWTVAYRCRNADKTLLEDTVSPFTCIPNTWRYWCADPHILENDGKTYIFAELYDRILRRGVIGYCTLTENGATPWKIVLKMPFHLSYPHILQKGNDVYMIPESYVANEIAVYRAVSFPDRWERCHVLKVDFCAVDTTVFTADEGMFAFTHRFVDDSENLMLYPVDENGMAETGICLSVGDVQMRPAGCLIRSGDFLYRPAQDCSESYGCALNLYRIESLDPYREMLFAKVKPEMIQSDLGRIADGIHTYNVSEHWEILDLKGYEIDPLFYIMRPIWFIWRRAKKLFCR